MSDAEDQSPVRSVARAVDLLMALQHGPMRLGDISVGVGLSKPTTHRILSSLRSKGMVMQDPLTGDYGLGPSCYHLMTSIVSGDAGFLLDARPVLEELRDQTRETITVHVRAGLSRICIQEFPSRQPIRYTSGLGATAGIHIGSAGKILLAYMPEADRRRILDDLRLTPMTDNTITDRATLDAELDQVATQGYAVSRGERASGAIGVSAPILEPNGRALAALSILGPAERIQDQIDLCEKRVRAAAELISTGLVIAMTPT